MGPGVSRNVKWSETSNGCLGREIPFPFELGAERSGPQKSEDEFVGAALIRETGFISGRGREKRPGSRMRAFVGLFCLLHERLSRLSDPYSSL